ncbi:sucrose transporter 2 [Medicago truncatula]|uniref:Sucrose transporter 2 n=1 Tax=Medicago truncatula TaxID=3880 RepID=G7K7J5_MEDTR|nr:sucrose transporter 2 [Medicago truncatula]QMS54613.1 sugar transporter [Medicago truncatula]
MVVQPLVSYYSDRSRLSFCCCRPFIACDVIGVVISALIIGYAGDLGHALGDNLCKKSKQHTLLIFILGFCKKPKQHTLMIFNTKRTTARAFSFLYISSPIAWPRL